GFDTAYWDHHAEDKRPNSHHPTAHFIWHDCLQSRIGGREKKEHAKSGEEQAPQREVETARKREGNYGRGKQINSAEPKSPWRHQMTVGGNKQRADQRARATRRNQKAVTIGTASKNIARERRHQDGVGPTENAHGEKKRQDRAYALMLNGINDAAL